MHAIPGRHLCSAGITTRCAQPTARCAPHFRALAEWLAETPAARVAQKRREADLLFHRVGITFAVYGDDAGAERLIPFDIVPRVIPQAEWERLARGLRQRVTALNRFLHDIYHDQEILKAGMIPAEQVLTQRRLPAGDARGGRARRRLRARRRHRPGAARGRRVLRARGQPAHALGRLVHAREPQDDDAALPRAFRAPAASSRSTTTPTCCWRRCARGAAARRATTRWWCVLTPGPVQQRLLRARLPRAADGRRAGRGRGPVRPGRPRLHAHHHRPAARRRDLPAHRRRLPRSARVPAGLDAGRAGPARRPTAPAASRSPTPSAPASPTTSRSIRTCPR